MNFYNFDAGIVFDMPNFQENDQGYTLRGRESSRIMRTLAPFALHHTLCKHGINSTLINYSDRWDADVLYNTVAQWINNQQAKNVLLLASTLFSVSVFHPDQIITKVIKRLQENFNCTVVLGGPIIHINAHVKSMNLNAVFQGRSIHLFEKWLVGQISDIPTQQINGITVYHKNTTNVVEQPIVPQLYDDYCLNENDIIHFETRLGCRFDCTFCCFEYRNAKKVNDSSATKLAELFQTAKDRYGITRFSCVDDTFNEDQVKIDTLHAAVQQLDFKPTIVGYSRFDVMMAKPEQVQQLDECGFVGHKFGIETFHREASQVIRKGIRKERAFEFLRMLRDDYPHWWVASGYIVGLPLEPAEHIMSVMKQMRDEKLMKGMAIQPLGLYRMPGHDHNMSAFSKDPEKYGLTLLNNAIDTNWTHDLMNRDTATMLANRIKNKNLKSGIGEGDPWEWLCSLSCPDRTATEAHIQSYINRKINYLLQ